MPETPPMAQPLSRLDDGSLRQLDALVVASGWNQVADDWRLFVEHGTVSVIRDTAGVIRASGATLPVGRRVSWISMILVEPALRGAGLGSAIFAHQLAIIGASGRVAMLDATPAGEPIYRRAGFIGGLTLSRWHRPARGADPITDDVPGPGNTRARRVAPVEDGGAAEPGAEALAVLARLDQAGGGGDRRAVLAGLTRRPGSRLVVDGEAALVRRRGRVADQIGPLLAEDDDHAWRLLRAQLAGPRALFIDVVDAKVGLAQRLTDAGFARQRGFTRMAFGEPPVPTQADCLYAITGPEFS